ncbi:MAG: RecQ family ATP-dependent DNA helicase [Treponema sp.]|jgi:ATP-dependent DNA helicase RecQ|nr:RecQ family ATP-dependent DNA helicase [Treponema sp.]
MTNEQLRQFENTDPLNEAVNRLFGLSYLFPYQRLVVANILEAAGSAGIPVHWSNTESAASTENSDIGQVKSPLSDRECLGRQIVILPTGAGKSLCFQLPAMLMDGPTLVIYPILGLMADQERRLQERGFSPVVLRGGQTREERNAIWEKLRSGRSKFIIANPEVLLTPEVMTQIENTNIVHIVIDEAHCVSEWGESFRPSYLEINKIIEAVKSPMVTAFTATAGDPVLEKIEKYIFGDKGAHRIIGNPDRGNIAYSAQGCILRDMAVRDLLLANQRPAIVFCSSRTGTENLARYLRNELNDRDAAWHKEIRFYHAGLSREEKKEVEGWFLHNSDAVLVATCAFGLGIDKSDIRTVIHRDCPPSVEAYLQESGRAGRDGKQSKAILLWGPDDEKSLNRAKSEAESRRLAQLLDYGRNITKCRRETLLELLNYEGSDESPGLPCCDVCESKANKNLREELSLTDFFRRNKRLYTINEAAHVLAQNENIRWSEEDVKQSISHLIKSGKLKKLNIVFWKNKITLQKPDAANP